nr:AsmA family protein [Allorhizobium sonneratiae]
MGGLVVVALFAALIAPYFVDWTDFRKDFEDQASRILGKKVVVHGAVSARILPFPSVTLNDVTVGPGSDGKTMAHVERFSMDAELAPFLSGEARIFAMRLEKPEIRLRILPDGRPDWLVGSQPSMPARKVVLEKVTVTDGSISLIDQQTGEDRHLSGINATLSADSLAGPWTVSGEGALDGAKGRFTLSTLQPEPAAHAIPLKLHLSPSNDPVDVDLTGDLSLTNGHAGLKGSFYAVMRQSGHDEMQDLNGKTLPPPRVRGRFALANTDLDIPEYRLEIGTDDAPYVITGKARLDTGSKPQFLLTADGQQINVDQLAATMVQGKTSRLPANSASQRIESLIAVMDRIPIPAVPGQASLRLPAIIAGDTVIRDVTLDLKPDGAGWQVDKAQATFPGRTRVEASGKLTLRGDASFKGSLLVASTQPSGLAGWLSGKVDPAIRQLPTLGFSANVDLTAERQRFDGLELAMGSASLHGRLERTALDGRAPDLSFSLDGNAFDYDAGRALASLIAGDNSTAALLQHHIAGDIKVGSFTAENVTAHAVNAAFTYQNGGFSVRSLKIGDLAGAEIEAHGEAAGSLADYAGTAQVTLATDNASGFLDLVHRKWPAQPLLTAMAANGRWFGKTDLTLNARFGDSQYGGLQLDLKGKTDGTALDVSMRQDSLFDPLDDAKRSYRLTATTPQAVTLLGQLGLNPLPVSLGGSGTLTVTLDQEGKAPASAKLLLSAGDSKLDAQGHVSLDPAHFLYGKGQVHLTSPDMAPLLLVTAANVPGVADGLPVSLQAGMSRQNGRLDVTGLTGHLAGQAISGDLTLNSGADTPVLSGRLHVDDAALGWLAATVVGPLYDPETGKLSARTLATTAWGGPDLDLQFEADRFDLGLLPQAQKVRGHVRLANGSLTLDGLSGLWLDGKANGSLSLSSNQGLAFLRGKLTVKQIDLAKMRQDSGLKGQADIDVSMEGSGDSVKSLSDAVSGAGRISVSDLSIPDFDLQSLADVKAAFANTTGEVAAPDVARVLTPLLARQPAVIGAMTLPFTLAQGRLTVQDQQKTLENATLSGHASADLLAGTVDAGMTLVWDAGDDAVAGATPSIDVSLKGPFTTARPELKTVDMANYLSLLAADRARRKVEMMQSNVLEKQRLRREATLDAALKKARLDAAAKADAEKRAADAAAKAAIQSRPKPPVSGTTNGIALPLPNGEPVR